MEKSKRFVYKCDSCGKIYMLLLKHHLILKNSREVDSNICGSCLKGELKYVGEGTIVVRQ